jgi:hypothetical protein
VTLPDVERGMEETDDGDDENIDMLETDGMRGRVNVARLGTFKGKVPAGSSAREGDLEI